MQSQKNCPIGTLKSFLRATGRHFFVFRMPFCYLGKKVFYMTKEA